MSHRDVYICGFARTPHGKRNGALARLSAAELGGTAINGLLERCPVPRDEVGGVIMGEVYTAGEGQNPARHAAIFGGLPTSCPAMIVNKVCSSSLAALESAVEKIQLGKANLMIAGGMENMSRAPYLVRRVGKRVGTINLTTLYEDVASSEERDTAYDSMFFDGLTEPSRDGRPTMAVLSDECAKSHRISQEDQEFYAFKSCTLAQMADRDGYMAGHIVPIRLPDGTMLTNDETLRMPDLKKIQKASAAAGCETVTAATMSQLADGASALIVASEKAVKCLSLNPLARIVDFGTCSHGLDLYPLAPAIAIDRLLRSNKLRVSDIGSFEINEASAVVPLYTMGDLKIQSHTLNMWGGSIAIGHPLGATGTRIAGTLAIQMQKRKLKYGIASTCNGGGEAMAVLLKRV